MYPNIQLRNKPVVKDITVASRQVLKVSIERKCWTVCGVCERLLFITIADITRCLREICVLMIVNKDVTVFDGDRYTMEMINQ